MKIGDTIYDKNGQEYIIFESSILPNCYNVVKHSGWGITIGESFLIKNFYTKTQIDRINKLNTIIEQIIKKDDEQYKRKIYE